MKIAVASDRKDSITEHAGKCQKFWLYNVETNEILSKECLELPKEQSFHNSSPHDPHPLDDIQVFIAKSMGNGLMRRLEKQGIEAVITEKSEPDEVVNAYLDGSLDRKTVASCHHDHDHEHKHEHKHKHGHQN